MMSMVKSATQTRTVRPVCAVTCRRLALSTKLDRVGTWIATSGWSYEHWQNVLYHGCPPADRLAPYVAEFDTVELNASFYRWPRGAAFTSWQGRLPTGSACRSRHHVPSPTPASCTHPSTGGRITAGWDRLYDKRGVLLVQLPPGMERDDARLDYFLGLLPWWVPTAVNAGRKLPPFALEPTRHQGDAPMDVKSGDDASQAVSRGPLSAGACWCQCRSCSLRCACSTLTPATRWQGSLDRGMADLVFSFAVIIWRVRSRASPLAGAGRSRSRGRSGA